MVSDPRIRGLLIVQSISSKLSEIRGLPTFTSKYSMKKIICYINELNLTECM